MAYIYRACKYEEVSPVHCFYDWFQGGISGAEFFVFYYAGCAACTKMGKVLGKEKFCIFPSDFFLEEFCNVVGRAFVALSVDYYCFHGVCSFFTFSVFSGILWVLFKAFLCYFKFNCFVFSCQSWGRGCFYILKVLIALCLFWVYIEV